MMREAWIVLVAIACAIAGSGCAIYPGTARPADLAELRGEQGWVLLDTVPDVRQVSDQGCGAACLAMVLGHWGIDSRAEDLEQECTVPGTEGILAASLRDAARRRGLSAFLLAGTPEDLQHELARGRPVLVGVAKPRGEAYTAHFEVVVGLHAGTRRIAALDPGIGLTCDSMEGFESEWTITKRVMLVVFQPQVMVAAEPFDVPGGGAR